MLDQNGNIVGMFGWGTNQNPCIGGGTQATTIRQKLGFDKWYGRDSIPDQTIGTFNTSTAQWKIDNGNGRLDTCSASGGATTTDRCFTYGVAGDIPLAGDWDGNGSITVGVFRPTNTTFYLRNANSAGSPNITLSTGPFDYQPVAGKWTGTGGGTKVGVFRSSTGAWYLDDGDFVAEGCPPDTCFTTTWTQTGDIPLAGDWDSNGTVTIGVFRPSTSTFYLSNAMPPTAVNVTVPAGSPSFGYQPVVGNWTGVGGTKLGVFRPSTSAWYLVSTTVPTNCATDQCVGPFGGSGDRPAAFGSSIIRAN